MMSDDTGGAFGRLIDDRPEFSMSFSMGEAMAAKDALSVASMLCEGNMEGVVLYLACHDHDSEMKTRDDLWARFGAAMAPASKRISQEIKALSEEHSERLARELEEDD